MSNSDPKQVIVDWLIRPSVLISESKALGEGGWRGQIRQGGHDADPATIRFLKERSIPGRQIHSVVFESLMDGRRLKMQQIIQVIQDDNGGWHTRGGAGGGAEDGPIREHPWVNLAGGGWPDDFYMGGPVIDNGLDIAVVRLVTGNGLTIEDTVDDGIVLFLTNRKVELPIFSELYDRAGGLAARHEAVPELRYEPPSV